MRKAEIPLADNPSGCYCPSCRACGFWHCADPDRCGGMVQMRQPPIAGPATAEAHSSHSMRKSTHSTVYRQMCDRCGWTDFNAHSTGYLLRECAVPKTGAQRG
jgi:hypothetical protein